MATSDFWQRVSETVSSSSEWTAVGSVRAARVSQRSSKTWMLLDVLTIFSSVVVAAKIETSIGLLEGFERVYQGTLLRDREMSVLLAMLCGFTIVLILTSRRLRLYAPTRLTSFLHEQRLSFQACFRSGLLLVSALYVTNASHIPRAVILITVGLVTVSLGLRRLVYRMMLYRRFDRGQDTRNVMIVGTSPEAHALRHHLESIRHLGYTFKGFIDMPGTETPAATRDVVGTLETLFQHARKQFVDEIFFTAPCEREMVQDALEKARIHGIDLRLIPDMYGGLVWNSPIEYIGQFPTVPLHRGQAPGMALVLKRMMDITFSALVLAVLSPALLAIAIAIKLDSRGPVFYASERLGKKGRVFRCLKFRSMVSDAEKRLADVMHMNERAGGLFKISKDPRMTRFGRLLRRYSLDELPQFLNVLRGEMSVVGPRPPIASEVREYKPNHLRRLDVMPGITGLWQVQGRQDPSFDSYVSLDVTYIENWSLWLDIKIIVRTVGVVLEGTGT
ncbi:MAG TPA: sugar transferase [Terracidiphilus sp.]|nr:sugar transferase [Terracidiphilus sp.]